jgi:hypothetical protein
VLIVARNYDRQMRKWLDEMSGLVWTLAGTALVLVTLSGSTRRLGLYISIAALALNLVLISLKEDNE